VVSSINVTAYSDALVVLGTAAVVVPLVRRWGFNPVLGYLGAGAVLGPFGLGSFIKSIPALYWITIADARNVVGIAQLGVVFLLFLIGLELSFRRLLTMRRLVFGLGWLQVLLTSALIGGTASLLGQHPSASVVLGTSLSLSSTAIVLELLANQGRLATNVGRTSFAVLLAQDIAVIPIFMFVSIAGASLHGSVITSLAKALIQALAAVAIIVVFGRLLLRPLFRLVASARSTDLFIASVLFVIIASAVLANQSGLSMALGAFVAGLLLAETEYGKAIQATVEPFKGLLLGVFFFTVGMNIDVHVLLREPALLLACALGLITLKASVLTVLGRLFGLSWPTSFETGLLLGPGGEFAFVGVSMAKGLALLSPDTASLALAATSVTMALTPLLGTIGRRLKPLVAGNAALDPQLSVRPERGKPHAIIVGYGRVGKVVKELLTEHQVPSIAADNDTTAVSRDRRAGHDVYYGDAGDPEFLKACGLSDATGVVITINAHDAIDRIVRHVREIRPDILVVARARDAEHARHLYSVGATDAVPETIEASLQLSEAALVGLGVPMGPAIASVHEKRDAFRRALHGAAQEAGRDDSYLLRHSSLRSRRIARDSE
jgi:CPA2 family monovalent cation:H+ antiporter-2